jgi:hypothetical protein
MTPALDPLESRQLLSTAALPVHGPVPAHHHQTLRMHHAAMVDRTATGHPVATPAATTGLTVVTLINPPNNTVLRATAAIADNDIWAIGYSNPNGTQEPVAVHFNGTSWSVVPTPSLSAGGELTGVAAAASNDVWAVGERNVGNSFNTLIEHWDGTSWSVVTSPSLPNGDLLNAVTAVSSNDVWAVGSSNNFSGSLIEHFNGTSWSVVSSPAGAGPLNGVSADASNDVWAVGGTTNLHFNGKSWSRVASPSTVNLTAVTTLSPTNAWAVGIGPGSRRNGPARGVIEHWDGASWNILNSPNPNTSGSSFLEGIAVISANNIWAVGAGGGTVTEQWDGTTWSIIASPRPGELFGVTALSDGTVVAVGSDGASGLILQN